MSEKSTRERLLDTAEQLFATKGIANTSTRDITGQAGVNLASVNYHFGSKEALVEEIIARRIVPVNEERLRMLRAYEKENGGQATTEQILRAFIAPGLEMLKHGEVTRSFFLIMGQIHASPELEKRVIFMKLFADLFVAFQGALAKALPHLDADTVTLRFTFVVGCMVHALFLQTQMATLPQFPLKNVKMPPQVDLDELSEELVEFTKRGMEG